MANFIYHGWDSSSPGDWSAAGNFLDAAGATPGGVPGAGDNVSITATANEITAGLASGATTRLGRVVFEKGWFATAGITADTGDTYLKLNCTNLILNSGGTTYIEINSAGPSEKCDIEVSATASWSEGNFGAYIKTEYPNVDQGHIGNYSQTGGSVAIAHKLADIAKIMTSCSAYGGLLELGHGCTLDGSSVLRVSNSTCVMRGTWNGCATTLETGATLRTEGSSANSDSVTLRGNATLIPNAASGSADLVTLNMHDQSLVDFMQSGIARTVTTLNQYGGRVRIDPSCITITNLGATTPFDRTVVPV